MYISYGSYCPILRTSFCRSVRFSILSHRPFRFYPLLRLIVPKIFRFHTMSLSNKHRQVYCLLFIRLLIYAELPLALTGLPIKTSSTMPIIQSVIHDNLVFVQEGGVFVEPTGFAYTYSTFIYENIHLVIPNQLDIDYHLPHCTEEENFVTGSEKKVLIDNVMTTLKTRVPEYKSSFLASGTPRNKRELVTLALVTAAGLMSLGISIYNTVQVNSVAQRSQKMLEEINRLSTSQAQTTHA